MSTLFASADDIQRMTGEFDERDRQVMRAQWTPTLGEYMGASVGQAFDRTLGVRAAEWAGVHLDELSAKSVTGKLEMFVDEDEFKASEDYRHGIEFEPDMSRVRARIYADNYDKRRERERVIAAGDENGPWYYGLAGFGAGIIGSLPDPVNLIPFGGQAVTGTKAAAMTTRQLLASSAKKGFIEGATGNLVSSSVAAWDLNKKGEDISAQEVLLDTMFGAVAGPIFGMAGGMLGRSAARSDLRGQVADLSALLPEDSQVQSDLAALSGEMRGGRAEAYGRAGKLTEEWNGQEAIRFLRRNMTDADRMEFARIMEFALQEFNAGRAVDVGPMLRESGQLGKLYDLALHRRVNADPHDPQVALEFNKLADEVDASLGRILFDIGTLDAEGKIIPSVSFGMVKVQVKHGEITRAQIMSLPRIIREYTVRTNEQGGYKWIVPTGEQGKGTVYIVKNFREKDGQQHVVTIHKLSGSQVKNRGGFSQKRTVDSASSKGGFAPSSEIPRDDLTNAGISPALKKGSRSIAGQESTVLEDNLVTLDEKVNGVGQVEKNDGFSKKKKAEITSSERGFAPLSEIPHENLSRSEQAPASDNAASVRRGVKSAVLEDRAAGSASSQEGFMPSGEIQREGLTHMGNSQSVKTVSSSRGAESAASDESISRRNPEVNGAGEVAEQNAIAREIERLRGEFIAAQESIPGLKNQIAADSTPEEIAMSQEMTPEQAAEHALDLHVAFARRLSAFGVKPSEYLRRVNAQGLVRDENGHLLTPEELEGKVGGQAKTGLRTLHQAAMNRSNAVDMADFLREARSGNIVYRLEKQAPVKLRSHFGINDLVINIPYTFVQHLDNMRPGMADQLVAVTPDVLAFADKVVETGRSKTGEVRYTAVRYRGAEADAVVFEVSQSRKKGNRAVPITAFAGKRNTVDAIIDQKDKAATSSGVGGDPNLPTSLQDEPRVLAASDKNIDPGDSEVNDVPRSLSHGKKGQERGVVSISRDNTYTVQLFKSADLSTLLHETGHIFLEEMERILSLGLGDNVLSKDYATIREWLKASEGQVLTRDQRETFARGFEAYLREGKAPSRELESAFDRFKKWLITIYKDAKSLNVELTDDVRGVFDRLLATQDEIDTNAAVAPRYSDTSGRFDWRTETPEGFPPLQPEPSTPKTALEQAGVNPETGGSPEEAMLAWMQEEGTLDPAGEADITAIVQDQAEVDSLEQTVLSVAGNLMGKPE